MVVEEDGRAVAFASTSLYRPGECYAQIAEFSVYAACHARGREAGRLAMEALLEEAEKADFWKFASRLFTGNKASCKLRGSLDFREVVVYEKHARLDGI